MVSTRVGRITAPRLGATGFFQFILSEQGFESVLVSSLSSLLTRPQQRDTAVARSVSILLAVCNNPSLLYLSTSVSFLRPSTLIVSSFPLVPSSSAIVIHDQADAKRIYREMYILRHIRHNEIIHLRDVLMPAAYENFRDLYLVSFVYTVYAPGNEPLLRVAGRRGGGGG